MCFRPQGEPSAINQDDRLIQVHARIHSLIDMTCSLFPLQCQSTPTVHFCTVRHLQLTHPFIIGRLICC